MGRAARRQQQRAERRGTRSGGAQPRPPRPQLSTSGGPQRPEAGGGSFFKPRWARDILSELRKVTWPTRQETAHLTVVVIVVSLAFGAVLGAADIGFSWIIEETILR